jgi:TRAP-type mannitol/chloroaromatic compound transport system permease large subunit
MTDFGVPRLDAADDVASLRTRCQGSAGAGPRLWPALWALIRDLLAPVALILSVLRTIVSDIETPTESAAIGAAGAQLLALMSRRLSLRTLTVALRETNRCGVWLRSCTLSRLRKFQTICSLIP